MSQRSTVWQQRLARPVCLYQMGKVGSNSLLSLLSQKLPAGTQLMYSHYLVEAFLLEMESWLGDDRWDPAWRGSVEQTIANMRQVGQTFAASPSRLTVVTAVRDPLAVVISSFLQNVEGYGGALVWGSETTEAGRIELLLEFLKTQTERWALGETGGGLAGTVTRFLLDYPAGWFDREMHASLDVDVYSYPFPHDQGYQIISTDQADVLILRYEDFSTAILPALHEFLGLTDVALGFHNRSEDKPTAPLARAVRERLRVAPEVVTRIYSTRHGRHFYTQSEREQFARRWTGEPVRLAS
ncbi:MAG: putative capsular polysaccharide synthesis family protein [Acidobacteriota bacterium]